MGLCNIPPERKCVLEIDTSEPQSSIIKIQQYWLYAIEAAQTVGEQARKLPRGKTTSWNEIMSDNKFNYLPTQSPLDEMTPRPKIATTPPAKAKKKTSSSYMALLAEVKTAKSKATAIRRARGKR